ncbi:hypothetical protein JCM19240_4740 [Vibrio maritimus]|uniref:Uncharacterized protein n=1 Tax=Vibrio maritimus TaxID=990268 RepID=A0A090T734_9VIBR|nr:hypothetical protein JCM19240_4740 [Vibrio maritimus]
MIYISILAINNRLAKSKFKHNLNNNKSLTVIKLGTYAIKLKGQLNTEHYF